MRATDEEIALLLERLTRDFAATRAARHLDALSGAVDEIRDWYDWMPDADIDS